MASTDAATPVPGGPRPVERASGLMAAAGLEISHGETSATARIHVDGSVPAAALTGLLADVTGGLLSLRTMAPLRVATSELSMHLARTRVTGDVTATAQVLRQRRHGLVVTVQVSGDVGTRLASATLNFAILGEARGPMPTDPGHQPVRPPATTIGAVLGFGDLVPTADGAQLTVTLADEQRNTFGALNGGLLTAAMSRTAAAAPRSVLGPGPVTVQLTQWFLAPARGPRLLVVARISGTPTPDLAVVDVTMVDLDHHGREPARATALVARAQEIAPMTSPEPSAQDGTTP